MVAAAALLVLGAGCFSDAQAGDWPAYESVAALVEKTDLVVVARLVDCHSDRLGPTTEVGQDERNDPQAGLPTRNDPDAGRDSTVAITVCTARVRDVLLGEVNPGDDLEIHQTQDQSIRAPRSGENPLLFLERHSDGRASILGGDGGYFLPIDGLTYRSESHLQLTTTVLEVRDLLATR
jgi:hypothetical protein